MSSLTEQKLKLLMQKDSLKGILKELQPAKTPEQRKELIKTKLYLKSIDKELEKMKSKTSKLSWLQSFGIPKEQS